MASSLSAYWVKFFKGAGFPQDVATRHALVFSNNRIKPDMLPDLDKPSLKEMGITLMGDMIAILRYAKKVVEETSCEKFLVDSEDTEATSKSVTKPVIKKAVTKAVSTKPPVVSKAKALVSNSTKIMKTPSTISKTVTVKKSGTVITDDKKTQASVKRRLEPDEAYDEADDHGWSVIASKKSKLQSDNNEEDKVGYTVISPKSSTLKSQSIIKKPIEQKRTVFERLGDSSVTSTTNSAETSPTFNITGLGKNVYKRSVFNRLGDKDTKNNDTLQTGILKNGIDKTVSQGILKKRILSTGASGLTTKKVITKGTMRADEEASIKAASNNIKKLSQTKKIITFNENRSSSTSTKRPETISGKLVSEKLITIPAKARLGIVKSNGVKQVTFNRVTTVSRVKRPDVFSRLGI